MKWLMTVVIVVSLVSCAKKDEAPGKEAGAAKGIRDEAHPEKYIEQANVVELSLDAQKRAGIEVATVRMSTVQAEVKVTGSVQPISRRPWASLSRSPCRD